MGSVYLQSGEYAAFGVTGATADDVVAASALIDAALQRPEGLVWKPDGGGWPCYMAAPLPTMSFTASGAISTGTGVSVTVGGGFASPDIVGDVLILDRANAGLTEACVVTAFTPTSLTLDQVRFAHAGGAVLEQGLVIEEERALPANRSTTRVSRTPVPRMIAAHGRYSYGRRSQQQSGVFADPSILASVQVFGGPPAWNPIDVSHISVSQSTGEVWIPAGALLANFSDVRLRYVAGYPLAGLPDAVKVACASVVKQMMATPELTGSIKSLQAGQTKIERFADTLLDAETKQRLSPFAAKLYY